MLKPTAKVKLINAATSLFRQNGYAATSVDALCAEAGVTKGAFFHHFKTKDDLGVAAAVNWSATTGELFRQAPYHAPTDPLERVLAYIDFRKTLLAGDIPQYTCLVGTLVQETYASHSSLREACRESIFSHAESLESDIKEAVKQHKLDVSWTAKSLAQYFQVTIQGAFILAKASGDRTAVEEALDHLKRYVQQLFRPDLSDQPRKRTKQRKKT